jgi:hypothetical protein
MLVDQPQTFALTRGEQPDRILGDDGARRHGALLKRGGWISSTLSSA